MEQGKNWMISPMFAILRNKVNESIDKTKLPQTWKYHAE